MNFRRLIPKIHISFGETEDKIKKIKKLQKQIKEEEKPKFKHLTDVQKRQIRKMNRQGYRVIDIAKELDIAPATVSYWLERSFKTPESTRRKQRDAYKSTRVVNIRTRHQKQIAAGKKLKNHDDCPFCYPDSKISYDEYVKRNRRINFSRITYARERNKIKLEKTDVQIHNEPLPIDFITHDRPLPNDFIKTKLLQRTPDEPPVFCSFPSCTESAEKHEDSPRPYCHTHYEIFKNFRNL